MNKLGPLSKIFRKFWNMLRSVSFRSFRLGNFKYLILIIVVIAILYNLSFVYIKPNEYGIKVIQIGMKRGVQEKIYPTGLHLVIPFGFQEMYRLPRDVQVLELTNSSKTASRYARMEKAAHIQTSDGYFVNVDVSILYRITDPFKVFTMIGPGKRYEENGIVPKAEPILKETLGELTTEEFYISPLRFEKTVRAKKILNEELNPKGIQVDQVLVRYFNYSNEIQKNIEEKKLKDQMVFKNQAEARAAVEQAKLKRIIEEGKARVAVELEKGEAYVTKKEAEKDLYIREKKAEADLLVKLAEAEKVLKKNDALKGVGSEKMVGLKMAEVLNGLNVIILPSDGPEGLNPLNLGKTLQLFDVKSEEKK